MIDRNTNNKIKLLLTDEKLLCIPNDNSTKLKQFFIPWAVYICIWAITLLVDWNLRNPNNPLEGGLGSSVLGGIYNINFFFFIILTIWAAFRFQNKISRFIFFFLQIGIAYILTIWVLMIYAVEYVGDTI